MRNEKLTTKYTCIFLFLYVLILLLGCSKFSPLYDFNYWADVNIYFTIGKGIWADKVIYKDLFDHKGPIIFFIYSIGSFLTHTSFLGMFVVQVLFQFVAVYFSYLTIRLFVRSDISLFLSLLIPIFLLVYSYEGGSAEEFVLVFQIISFYAFLSYFIDKDKIHPVRYMVTHGAMFTIVLFIKLNLVIFWFFPLLIIFISLLANKLYAGFFKNIFGFILGILIVLAPLLSYFYYNDALQDLWDAYFQFNFLYGDLNIISVKDYILGVGVLMIKETISHYIVIPIIILGLLFFMFGPFLRKKAGRLAICLSAISLVWVILSTRVLLNYYLIPFMLFSILACIVVGLLFERMLRRNVKKFIHIFFLIACVAGGFYLKDFFGYSPSTLYTRDFAQTSVELFSARILKTENPTLLVAGFKRGLPVYTKTGIVPNTKYFFFPNIHHEVFPEIRNSQTRYIKNQEVEFVVLYKNFRYYEHYREALKLNYMIDMEFVDPIGGVTYLYRRI